MKKFSYKAAAATYVAATAMLIGMSACKGRTMDNVEPTGETIEVMIDNPSDQVSPDSIPMEDEDKINHV